MSGLTAILLTLLTSCSRPAPGNEWKLLEDYSISLYQQGNYDGAVVAAKEALRVAEKTVGPDHPDVATSLNNLGKLYGVQGQYAQAETLYKRALTIREKALSSDHPAMAVCLS